MKLTNDAFSYDRHKVNYTVSIAGVDLFFVHLWPDSKQRVWIADQIARREDDRPILLFSHDAPSVEVKHLINPNGDNGINAEDRFENILQDTSSVISIKERAVAEELELAKFLRANPSIKGYFHGDCNYSEFYMWRDPNGNDVIPTFRVDSPMKGEYSKKDDSLLSFMLISIDTDTQRLTTREVLWNRGDDPIWGESCTISL